MKKAIRVSMFILSAICVLLNIGPVFTSGEINVGILFGLALAAVSFTYGLFFDKINSLIKKIFSHTAGKVILSASGLVICLCTALFIFTFVNVISHGRDSEKKTDYIIVLGCAVNGEEPGIFLRGRINKAYEYLTENPESKAILSGGQGSDENISEGICMFNTLTEMGIDEARLIVEDESTSTIQNFNNSIEKLKAEGIEINEITIVTNDFHEYRASGFAKRCGLKAYSYPSKTPLIGYTPFAVREVFATVYQIYLGQNKTVKSNLIR